MHVTIDKGYAQQLQPVMKRVREVLYDLLFDGGTVAIGIPPITIATLLHECTEIYELNEVDCCIAVGLMEMTGLVCIDRQTGRVSLQDRSDYSSYSAFIQGALV